MEEQNQQAKSISKNFYYLAIVFIFTAIPLLFIGMIPQYATLISFISLFIFIILAVVAGFYIKNDLHRIIFSLVLGLLYGLISTFSYYMGDVYLLKYGYSHIPIQLSNYVSFYLTSLLLMPIFIIFAYLSVFWHWVFGKATKTDVASVPNANLSHKTHIFISAAFSILLSILFFNLWGNIYPCISSNSNPYSDIPCNIAKLFVSLVIVLPIILVITYKLLKKYDKKAINTPTQ